MMFGNYKRLVYLAQTDDAHAARSVPKRPPCFSGSPFEQRRTGYGELTAVASSGFVAAG